MMPCSVTQYRKDPGAVVTQQYSWLRVYSRMIPRIPIHTEGSDWEGFLNVSALFQNEFRTQGKSTLMEIITYETILFLGVGFRLLQFTQIFHHR